MDYSKLTDEELTKMYNETVQGEPDYSSLSDEELNNLYNKTVLQGSVKKTSLPKEIGKGLLQGVASLGTGLGKQFANPLRKAMGKRPLSDYEIENAYAKKLGKPVESGAGKAAKVVGEIVPYLALPELAPIKGAGVGAKIGNMALTGAYQGGVAEGLTSLANKGFNPKENLKDVGIGVGAGAVLNPVVGLGAEKVIQAGSKAVQNARRKARTDFIKSVRENYYKKVRPVANEATEQEAKSLNEAYERYAAKELEKENNLKYEQDFENLLKEEENKAYQEQNKVIQAENAAKRAEEQSQNQQIADQFNDKMVAARQELENYEQHLAEFNEKYGNYTEAKKLLSEHIDEFGRPEAGFEQLQMDIDRLEAHMRTIESGETPYLREAANINKKTKNLESAKAKKVKEDAYVKKTPVVKEEPFAGDVTAEGAEMPTMAQTVDNTISKTEEIPITPDNKNIRQSTQTVLEQTNYDPQIVSLIEDNPELKYYNPINLKQKVQDLSKLSNEELSAKALSENNDIDNVISRKILLENGLQNKNINYALLDRTITGGTEQAQAFVARKIMNIGTPEGALIAARKAMIDVLPKKTREVIKNGNKIAKKILTSEEKASKILDHYGVQGKNQKIILNKLEKLNKLGELNEETVYTALCEGYNVKNLTDPQIEKITELSKNIANATTDREKVVAEQLFWKNVNKFAPNFWKKLSQEDQTYRTINMLLSPKSRIKDYVGSALYQGERVLDEIAAQGVSLISRGLGYKTRALGLDNKAWRSGYKRGLKEIGEDVELGINTGRSGEGSRYDLSNFPVFEDVPVLGKAEKILNYTIKAIDRPFYEAAYEASLANQMRAAGVTEPTQEMIEQAVLEGKQAIFQRNGLLTNSGLKLRDALDNIAPDLRLGQRLVPFLQTIGNLTQEGINATPLTLPTNIYKYVKGIKNSDIGAIRDAELALGKNLKGGLLYAPLGLALANNEDNNIGQINNSFNAEQEVTNRPDQSFRLGNQYYSIANFPQASIPLAFYKGLFSNGSVPERMVNALLSPINAIASLPANKTIGDLVKGGSDVVGELSKLADEDNNTTLNDVIEGPVANTLKQLGANLVSQYVPAGGFVSNIRNITDNNRRELSTDSIPEYIKNRIINRIPFASETLPLKYDVTGEPVENSNIENDIARWVAALADPFEIRNVEPTPKVMKYLDDLQNFAKENDIRGGKTTLQLRKAKNYIGNKKSNRVKLTGEQYAEFSRQMQTALYEMKNELINDPDFLQLPEKEQIKVITKRQKQIKDEIELDTLRRIYGEQ